MRIMYISGPYTPRDAGESYFNEYCSREHNINMARWCAAWCANNGFGYYCPHLNSAHMDNIVPDVPYNFWIQMDLVILEKCDALLLLPNWRQSKGAMMEFQAAENMCIPMFEFPDETLKLIQWSGEWGKWSGEKSTL